MSILPNLKINLVTKKNKKKRKQNKKEKKTEKKPFLVRQTFEKEERRFISKTSGEFEDTFLSQFL